MLSLDYVAGIIDGEGHIGLMRSSKRSISLRPTVAVKMCNPKVPKALKEQFGGELYVNKRLDSPTKAIIYEWRIQYKKAVEFLILIESKLIIKRTQALLVIKYRDACKEMNRDQHDNVKDIITYLNRRGRREA